MGVSRTEGTKRPRVCGLDAGVAGEMGKSPKDWKLLLPLSWPWEPVLGADTAGGTTTVGRTLAGTAGEGTTTSNAVEASPLRNATVSATGAARSKIAFVLLPPSSLTWAPKWWRSLGRCNFQASRLGNTWETTARSGWDWVPMEKYLAQLYYLTFIDEKTDLRRKE